MIFDSCTFAWHTGQLTVNTEEEDEEEEEEGLKLSSPAEEWREAVDEDEEAVAVLCCIAGDLVFIGSLGAAESLSDVFWKKSAMLDGLLRSSHGLFLDARPVEEAPDVPSLLEGLKYLECVGIAGLPWVFVENPEWLDLVSLGLEAVGEEADAFVALFAKVKESLSASGFEVED